YYVHKKPLMTEENDIDPNYGGPRGPLFGEKPMSSEYYYTVAVSGEAEKVEALVNKLTCDPPYRWYFNRGCTITYQSLGFVVFTGVQNYGGDSVLFNMIDEYPGLNFVATIDHNSMIDFDDEAGTATQSYWAYGWSGQNQKVRSETYSVTGEYRDYT